MALSIALLSAGFSLPSTAVRTVVRTPLLVRCELMPPGWKEVTDAEGKAYYYNVATGVSQWQKPVESKFNSKGDSAERSLTPDSAWRVRLDLTAPGCATPVTVTATLRFAEEEGYEPPQGATLVESCMPEDTLSLGQQSARWLLSEDPEDRGDSLWIWGLFKEPLYPFMLLELDLSAPVEMPVEGVSIPAGKLYCQIDHRRKDGSVQLGEGVVTYKVSEKVAADLVGLSEVTYDEPVECGRIRFLDTAEIIGKSYI